ncbi:hypothetical protein KIPB_000719 [Kipferlia bialata]|uniref:HotDog ACOT-type domain-containing protein n=1 Tax=Kipferlia bialata TaxID=797122 RepID=A0A9K3CQZ2_9EUKA|nr:hypothetical protein KIPB_000719 [Kipferlia bialata]|eukprot:g719.t1
MSQKSQRSVFPIPIHCNMFNTTHGGQLLRLMDEAGGLASQRVCNSRVMTVGTHNVSFLRPALLGYCLAVKATPVTVSSGAVWVHVDVHATEHLEEGEGGQTPTHIIEGWFVYLPVNVERDPETNALCANGRSHTARKVTLVVSKADTDMVAEGEASETQAQVERYTRLQKEASALISSMKAIREMRKE